jgi:hypothetical protein
VTQYVQFVYCSRSRLQFRFLPIYLLARARLDSGTGPTRVKKLIEHYGTAERVFQASLTALEATGMRRFRAIAGYGKVARIGAAGMREGGRGGRQDYFAQRC